MVAMPTSVVKIKNSLVDTDGRVIIVVMTGSIFDIKRFAIHDGPGIRVTFFMQGCPLCCWWCHNPESIPLSNERLAEMNVRYPVKNLTAQEVLAEAEKDRIFMDESGGGITFSGGEPLLQFQFLVEACTLLKEQEFHITLDTSGFASNEALDALRGLVDLYLYDLKLIDDNEHKRYTGRSVVPVLDNLERLLTYEESVWVRIPIIPGITDTPENLKNIRDWLKKRKSCRTLCLIPYHSGGTGKYEHLNIENRISGLQTPTRKRMEEIGTYFEVDGHTVKVGG